MGLFRGDHTATETEVTGNPQGSLDAPATLVVTFNDDDENLEIEYETYSLAVTAARLLGAALTQTPTPPFVTTGEVTLRSDVVRAVYVE